MEWTDILSYFCLAFYGLATVATLIGLLGRSAAAKRLAVLFCTCGFAAHTLWLVISLGGGAFSQVSRGFYLMPLSWVLTGAGLFMARRHKQDIALHFVSPWAFFLGSCAVGFAETPGSALIVGPLFIMHLLAVFVGVAVMAVAAGSGTLFLLLERSIKSKTQPSRFLRDMPSLATLDKVNATATIIGFPCYSIGVLCGFLWARIHWHTFGTGDIKVWISLVILAVYALLFHQRQALGWRGRKPAILAIVIFAASLFSMFVVNTAFPTQHGF